MALKPTVKKEQVTSKPIIKKEQDIASKRSDANVEDVGEWSMDLPNQGIGEKVAAQPKGVHQPSRWNGWYLYNAYGTVALKGDKIISAACMHYSNIHDGERHHHMSRRTRMTHQVVRGTVTRITISSKPQDPEYRSLLAMKRSPPYPRACMGHAAQSCGIRAESDELGIWIEEPNH